MKTNDLKENREVVGIDSFRIIAVILVVMIHTYPFANISEIGDYVVTRIVGRIAVPFFFMVTGYFTIPKIMNNNNLIFKSLKRLINMYGIAVLIYLPINILKTKLFSDLGIIGFIKEILFNGTFYHLWYLPATIIGLLIIGILLRKFKFSYVLGIASILYIIGLLGDNYYGIAINIPGYSYGLQSIYEFFDYTRNGIFFAPIFLMLGASIFISRSEISESVLKYKTLLFLILMIVEGLILYNLDIQKHNSMYIFLVPLMLYLFKWILTWKTKDYSGFRDIGMIIYIIHPLVIILVRAVGSITRTNFILVENNLIHFIVVLIVSFVIAKGYTIINDSDQIKRIKLKIKKLD